MDTSQEYMARKTNGEAKKTKVQFKVNFYPRKMLASVWLHCIGMVQLELIPVTVTLTVNI